MSRDLGEDGLPPLDVSWLNDLSDFQRNFIHGLRNPSGLHLQYRLEGEVVVTDWTPGDDHVGFPGVAHGGLSAAILDDVMGRTAALRRRWVVTGRFEVRFRAAAPAGVRLRVEGWMTRYLRRAVYANSRMLLPDGTVLLEATGLYLPMPTALEEQMVAAWPGFAQYLGQEHRV